MMLADGIHNPRRGALPEGGVLTSLNEREEIMAKKKNSRKALAVALGIMGIAGLSVASASTLLLDTNPEVGIGVKAFAPCQTSKLTASYTYGKDSATGTYEIKNFVISGVDATCTDAGAKITVELQDPALPSDVPNVIFTSGPTDVVTGDNTYDADSDNVPLTRNLGDVVVIIS